jgi:hypothetical protein
MNSIPPPARNLGFALGITLAAVLFDGTSAFLITLAGRDDLGLIARSKRQLFGSNPNGCSKLWLLS